MLMLLSSQPASCGAEVNPETLSFNSFFPGTDEGEFFRNTYQKRLFVEHSHPQQVSQKVKSVINPLGDVDALCDNMEAKGPEYLNGFKV